MKTILATGIPEMNVYIRDYVKFLEIIGEDQTKEGCVSLLADNPNTELAVITPFLPGNPAEPKDFIAGLCGAFDKLKILAILPPTPPQEFVDYLDSFGVYSLYGDITSDLLIEALTCVVENRSFNPSKAKEIAASQEPSAVSMEKTVDEPSPAEELNNSQVTDDITSDETRVSERPEEGQAQERPDTQSNEKPLVEYESLSNYQGADTNETEQAEPVEGEGKALETKHLVIAVFSPCHSGTTTLVANLALIMANRTDKVALIDLNTTKPDIKTHYSITHYNNIDTAMTLLAGNNLNSATLMANTVEHNGINVMLGTQNPFTCEISEASVKTLIEKARNTFNLTIIDVSGDIANWATLAAMQEADKVVVVLEQHIACLQYFNQIKTEVFPNYEITDSKVDIVLNRYHDKASLSPGEVKASIGHELSCILNETSEVYSSITVGTPLVENFTTKMGREFVKTLEKYVINLINGLNIREKPKKRGSLIQKFFRKNAV